MGELVDIKEKSEEKLEERDGTIKKLQDERDNARKQVASLEAKLKEQDEFITNLQLEEDALRNQLVDLQEKSEQESIEKEANIEKLRKEANMLRKQVDSLEAK